jgi:neutral ceramidase
VSGDNKGYASYLLEKLKNGPTNVTRPGLGKYVAGFPATNLGDVSPNTAGPRCRDTGLPCDTLHSTCNGRNEQCSAFGPGKDMYDSCEIIGRKQFDKAVEIERAPQMDVGGTVDAATMYVKMPGLNVTENGKHVGNTCKAAMGDSFAAGTTDGPGQLDFRQGANSSNPLWHFAVGFLHRATKAEKACQEPKGILLPTGSIKLPWAWGPDTVAVQILRLGNFVIIVVPTELTTMAGRRVRAAVKAQMVADGVVSQDAVVVIAGLGNGYADYTVTYEEYQKQRYEAASTIFGPHQLSAYIMKLTELAHGMATGAPPAGDAPPEDFSHKLVDTGKHVSTDNLPRGAKAFGAIMKDAEGSYRAGDMAEVEFAGGNPLNNLRHQGTFMEVQRCVSGEPSQSCEWSIVATDTDWETRITIVKQRGLLRKSARSWVVTWNIPADAVPGTYRIVHNGTYAKKALIGGKVKLTEYTGATSYFTVGV